MSLLLETIRIENGTPVNLGYHQRRVDRSRKALFGTTGGLDLLSMVPHDLSAKGIYKWRIVYGRRVTSIKVEPYVPKKVRSLQMVRNDSIEYPFKYADRSAFEHMLRDRGSCDDILVIRNGLVTDTSYANVAFFDGKNWLTPKAPLLRGTCRERLLETGIIVEAEIREAEVSRFVSVTLINAMLDPGIVVVPAGKIIPVPSNR